MRSAHWGRHACGTTLRGGVGCVPVLSECGWARRRQAAPARKSAGEQTLAISQHIIAQRYSLPSAHGAHCAETPCSPAT
jgi:hypothetical protein